MDAYPGDLLAGVFPLVFAVDSILSDSPVDHYGDGDAENDTSAEESVRSTSSTRSLFDRFLDAMASNLIEESRAKGSRSPTSWRTGSDTFAALLRGDDGTGPDDSSDEDELLSIDSASASSRRISRLGIGAPPLLSATRPSLRTSLRHSSQESTAYAKSLKVDGFFERARIVPVSSKHGFPPSKDPSGQNNSTVKLEKARNALAMNPTNANALRLKRILDDHPIDGVMPSGWLEKHVHALPSVLLVVNSFQIQNKDAQDAQDKYLVDTVQHLRESLAAKRECSIRLVCLADTPDQPTTPAKVDEWISRIKRECDLQRNDVTMLQIPHDLNVASPGLADAAGPMQKLHKEVRDASWTYYLSLARHNKRKLGLLGHDQQPALLPLAVRYTFKIGLYYEFLLKHAKALRYFSDSYTFLQTYYRYLLGKASVELNPIVTASGIVNPQADDGGIEAAYMETSFDEKEEEAGVEVALADDEEDEQGEDDTKESAPLEKKVLSSSIPLDVRKLFTEIDPPFDMARQCRTIADWLNFKIVQAGLQSAAFSDLDAGVLAASAQWRRHCQVFLKHDDPREPNWSFWKYISQQRHAMSQLVERFPPRNVTSVGGMEKEEILMRCSPWRNYLAAAEAILRVGFEVRKALEDPTRYRKEADVSDLRGRFVGGLDSDGCLPLLQEEAKRNHYDLALEMLNRAISKFEKDLEQSRLVAESEETMIESFHRSGARIYYLAGGILFGKKRDQDAIVLLEKAVRYAQGWKSLELVIRRMLIECYEKHLPSQSSTTEEQGSTIASMILDSYFNSKMSSRNLRRALDNFSSLCGNKVMKWRRECINESDASLPFSFAVTFPGTTHATTGDVANACVMVKSNLDYAVHINSVTLLSMAGEIEVPSNSLLRAQNANEGNQGGIIVQANTAILFSTQLQIPRSLDEIATDESGNGGEKQGTAGKGSFAKSARPRTAGVTSAAGARLIAEHLFEKGPQDKNSQWSVRYLGGKPLRCDGLKLVFYPVHVEKAAVSSGASNVNVIELTIEKMRPRTAANIKRTPFEEDNYVESAWSRPDQLPLSLGPRCLRILGPMPQMIVTNISESFTGGNVVEGTVNRVLVKLQAGPMEICKDIKCQLRFSSTLLALDGSTTHLHFDLGMDSGVAARMGLRIPVLVCADESTESAAGNSISNDGWTLPNGWKLLGPRQGDPVELQVSPTTLKMGEETYLYFDVYRPHQTLPPIGGVDETGSKRSSEESESQNPLCRSDFDLTVAYKQERPKVPQVRGRRRRAPLPGSVFDENKVSGEAANEPETVSLEYTGSITWISPFAVDFVCVDSSQKGPPSGNRHPSNALSNEPSEHFDSDKEAQSEFALVDGERVHTRCTLRTIELPNEVDVEVSRVWFQENSEGDNKGASHSSPCSFLLLVENPASSSLFEARENSQLKKLGNGRKISVVLSVEAHTRSQYKMGSVSSHLGILCVDWAPCPLEAPQAAQLATNEKYHGPLRLLDYSTIKFRGPACYIESAPFSVRIHIHTPSPRIGFPFEVSYFIKNNTGVNQIVTVELREPDGENDSSVVIAGSLKTDFRLSPQASQIVSYTAVATKPGKSPLPAVLISSTRYRTWIVKGDEEHRCLYVLP